MFTDKIPIGAIIKADWTGKLEPIQQPAEYPQRSANTQLWLDVESARSGD